MKHSQRAIRLISEFEGCELTAYKCSAGKWTIGYGHTATVKQGMKITKEQAIALLDQDISIFEKQLDKYLIGLRLTQGQYDAILCFTFNVGIGNFSKSTMFKLIKAGDIKGAALEFPKWNKAGGQVLSGLTRRRLAEQDLFLTT